jgi:feruloyl esterase
MNRALLAASAMLTLALVAPAHAQLACDSLKGLQLPDVTIRDVKAGPSPASLSPQGAKPVNACVITGTVGREINFVIALPEAWNGKFAMGGQGGIAGTVGSQAGQEFGGLQLGYAIAGTDTGHTAEPGGAPPTWAMDPFLGPERQVNYLHAGIHRVTVVSKQIVAVRYGRKPEKSYFAGCSNGGRQGLIEAQHYADDFDAVLAGAPATNITTLTLPRVDAGRKIFPDPKDFTKRRLDDADRNALARAVLDACDAGDGLKDGILSDPASCRFDPTVLACKGGQKDACLTPGGLAAVRSWYGGAKENGVAYSLGFYPGGESEGGWGGNLTGPEIAPRGTPGKDVSYAPNSSMLRSLDFLRYFLNRPEWSYAGPTLASMAKDLEALKTYNADNPDLSQFRKHGGKVLMFHGLIDPTISAKGTMAYTDAKDASAKADVRFFPMPGMGHCGGGPGPQRVEWLNILDAWATGGPAPDEATAAFLQGGGARKLCAYPLKAVFKGAGDCRSPDQFACR